MLQTFASGNVANRRSILRLAVATAALVPISRKAVALDRPDHHMILTARSDARKTASREQKTLQTAAVLRDLWIDHIFWVRNVSSAAIDKNESALKAAEQQAVKNAQDRPAQVGEQHAVENAKAIAASIEPFYGASAKDSFFKLLAGHYGAVKAYLVATVASDASAQKEATQALTSNAEDIAAFLSKANPYLPKDAVASLLLAHGGHHIQQIQQLKDRKYEAEAITWEEMKKHVYQVADATADALAKQFTKRFT